jgi:hypothetical protein
MNLPYDTLLDKDPLLLSGEFTQFALASRVTIDRAGQWLKDRAGCESRVLERRDLSLLYKSIIAFGLLGWDREERNLLDWIAKNAVAPSGDLYVRDVEPNPGVYRESWILRGALHCGHELGSLERVRSRMRQYQSEGGAVWDSIGDDPQGVSPQGGFSVASTCGFGLWAVDAGLLDEALGAANWLADLVDSNTEYMKAGKFYFRTDDANQPVCSYPEGADFGHVVRVDSSTQPTWVLGLAMAFLTAVVDALLSKQAARDTADRFIHAAERLAELQNRMPVETYFSWNSCKIAWSAGRMLDVWIKYGLGDLPLLDELYRAGRRTYLHTFLGTRLVDGGWGHDFYPPSSLSPEAQLDQRTFDGLSSVPDASAWQAYRGDAAVIPIDAIEISAENLVMLLHLERGFRALASELRLRQLVQ